MNTEITTTAHETQSQNGNLWSGGMSPFKTTYGKVMMWYFLLSDAFTFAGFLIAYGALRSSMETWPVPDFVFSLFPGLTGSHPLLFVTFMTFVLLFSSFTMMRAVQEGHRENKAGVVKWMLLTILGGAGFLSCQAWEWSTLIGKEGMSVTRDPFGTHVHKGVYLLPDGSESDEVFEAGEGYLIHQVGHGHGAEGEHTVTYEGPGDYPGAVVDEAGFIHKKYKPLEGPYAGQIMSEQFGPKAFGALFFFITGFHGFHVFSGVLFLTIIMLNVASGLYVKRRNGYEMVEKIGLYWHFVDLVWVFVFLVFYLL